MKSHLSNITVS